ncbi:transposase [Minisyncoccus archaeiphilus]
MYGYMNSTFSSRQIAKQLKENLTFMYLSGNERHGKTISRFRKEKRR